MVILKVAGKSSPRTVAGAIAGEIRQRGEVDIRAIGHLAVNQAIKSLAMARVYLEPEGIDIWCQPELIPPPEGQDEDSKTVTSLKVAVK